MGEPACGPLAEEQEGKYSTDDEAGQIGCENRSRRINPGEIVPQQLVTEGPRHLY